MANQLIFQKIKTIRKKNDDYPRLLREIPDAPEKIFALGNLQNNENLCLLLKILEMR